METDKISKKFFELLENLNEEDWEIKVDDEWTIKDVIAHLIGWEKETLKQLSGRWKTKEKPWFLKTDNYDEFNQRTINEYKDYNPKQLLKEWKYRQGLLDKKIEEIGEEKIRAEPEFAVWVFDEGDSHYAEHFNQIMRILLKEKNN